MKQLHFLFFVALLSLGLSQNALGQTTFTYQDINYNVTSASTVEVGYNWSATGDITIPQTVIYSGTSYNVTAVGAKAFSKSGISTNITRIELPSTVTSIKFAAFTDCTSLQNITLPSSLNSIGDGAFYNCTGLTQIVSLIQDPNAVTVDSNTFTGVGNCTLYVPQGKLTAYQGASQWSRFNNAYNRMTEFIPVTSISVQGQNGATAIDTNAGTLQMEITPNPSNTTIKTTAWSVNDTDLATISDAGMLIAIRNGVVIVSATVTSLDGSRANKQVSIALKNQTPTPLANGGVGINTKEPSASFHVYDKDEPDGTSLFKINRKDGTLILKIDDNGNVSGIAKDNFGEKSATNRSMDKTEALENRIKSLEQEITELKALIKKKWRIQSSKTFS